LDPPVLKEFEGRIGMRSKNVLFGILSTAALLAFCESVAGAQNAKERILYDFCSQAACADGDSPFTTLTFDSAGNIYGTTQAGGATKNGVVFELVQNDGSWTESVLYSFVGGDDGARPTGNLLFDSLGNLYGTTRQGGVYGGGTVFELSPGAGDLWVEVVLYNFGGFAGDGNSPVSLTLTLSGSLYGFTEYGGLTSGSCPSIGCGAVFELSPGGVGAQWTESILHSFQGGSDGALPVGIPAFDASGDLFGATIAGGGDGCHNNPDVGCGTVFELSPLAGGWVETIAYAFQGKSDGAAPYDGVILDAAGNLYGTAAGGGIYGLGACDNSGRGGCGVVFELTLGADEAWTESILHSFHRQQSGSLDGANPYAGLVFDASGNLYSTATFGGKFGQGTAFRLIPAGPGKWVEQQYSFQDAATGYEPNTTVTLDSAGNAYGVSELGGNQTLGGLVYEIVP
jgi:uncharacterized repeat protein (TIGR03803 family)